MTHMAWLGRRPGLGEGPCGDDQTAKVPSPNDEVCGHMRRLKTTPLIGFYQQFFHHPTTYLAKLGTNNFHSSSSSKRHIVCMELLSFVRTPQSLTNVNYHHRRQPITRKSRYSEDISPHYMLKSPRYIFIAIEGI